MGRRCKLSEPEVAEWLKRAQAIVDHPSKYQVALFGEAHDVRVAVFAELVRRGLKPRAIRYGLCGCGDVVESGGAAGARILSRGCGDKLCPRCSRKRGGKYVRRILGHLAHEPHGDVWAVCLTQIVVPGEGLQLARERMDVKARAFLRSCKVAGSDAGMQVGHLVWSRAFDGWHYHVHLMLEGPDGWATEVSLTDMYRRASVGTPDVCTHGWCRLGKSVV